MPGAPRAPLPHYYAGIFGASLIICNKSDAADSLGDHQVGCGGNGDRIYHHDALRHALFSAAQSAALGPRKEVRALIAGSCSRPGDIFLPHWCGGRSAAMDVTVISPLQSLTLAGAASVKGHALQVAEDRERAAHNANCAAAGVVLLPIVVEALGGWSEEAVFHISKIGGLMGQPLGLPPNETTSISFKISYLPVEGECIAMVSPFSSTYSMGGWKHLTLSSSPLKFNYYNFSFIYLFCPYRVSLSFLY